MRCLSHVFRYYLDIYLRSPLSYFCDVFQVWLRYISNMLVFQSLSPNVGIKFSFPYSFTNCFQSLLCMFIDFLGYTDKRRQGTAMATTLIRLLYAFTPGLRRRPISESHPTDKAWVSSHVHIV